METPNEIIARIVSSLNNDLSDVNPTERVIEDGMVHLPIFYMEDEDGNIKFAIECIADNFRDLIRELENYNEDYDNFA